MLAKTLRCSESILSVTRKTNFFKTWKTSPWQASKNFVNNVVKRSRKPNYQEISMVRDYFRKNMSLWEQEPPEQVQQVADESLMDTIERKSSKQVHDDKYEENDQEVCCSYADQIFILATSYLLQLDKIQSGF